MPIPRPTRTSGSSIGCWRSPHYGERWGRHWLDVAGYADSEGYDDQDRGRPEAYRYRDYVVNAFNKNKPFDEFVIEQLAGDELRPAAYKNLSADAIEKLAATGFLRMAADGTATAGGALPVASNQVMADTIKIVSTSLLGLSVGCAQCHDHRYDPILQDDYYRMRAVFEPALNWKNWRVPEQRRVSLYSDADRAEVAALAAEINKAAAAYSEKQQKYIARASTRSSPPSSSRRWRRQLKAAFDTPAAKRTAEQKALLSRYPSMQHLARHLYQYDQPAADELKQDAGQDRRRFGLACRASSSSVCSPRIRARRLRLFSFIAATISSRDKRSRPATSPSACPRDKAARSPSTIRICRPRAGVWLTPAASCRASIRWWAACSSIASGCSISAAASSALRPISAAWANGRHIPNSGLAGRRVRRQPAGTSSGCSG